MVNELITLSISLGKAGISPENWVSALRPLPNASKQKPCFRIVLDKQGEISEISVISMDLVPRLKKYEPSNGNSFPGFNLNPLYRIAIDKSSNEGKEIQQFFKAWRDEKNSSPINMELLEFWMCDANNNWDSKQNEKLDRCLEKVVTHLDSMINAKEAPSLAELIRRTGLAKDDFRLRLIRYIQSRDTLPVELLRLTIHEGDTKKDPKKDRGSVSVFLEIEGWEEISGGRPIANEQTIKQINQALSTYLSTATQAKNKQEKDSTDAYGNTCSGASNKMPDVKLPILGGVKLRAMNSESPCQNRYGTIDACSFQVGEESRKQAKGALEWLAKDSHEGKTWCRSGLEELVFIYPESIPEIPIQMAGLLTPVSSEQLFTEATKEIANALKGTLENKNKDILINVFALRKMDKARTKVVFDRNYTAQCLLDAATEWQQGSSNIPEIHIRFWGNEKGKIKDGGLITPYPLQIAHCVNRIWKMDGTSECEGQDLQPSDGISILMDDLSAPVISQILSVAIKNGSNLLRHVGAELNRGEVLAANKGIQKYKRMMPSILGLLLFKLNINKDHYMKQTPFLLGQLLKLSDEIHALYCEVVRKKQYPQQLLGNALLTSASESPKQALSTLCSRLSAYIGWAKTHRFEDKPKTEEFTTHKRAGWLLNLYESVADQLADLSIPERFSDADRAQLLIGYLASHPKKESSSNKSINN